MDSSNNDSFGSFGVSGGTGGSGSVISSGGDSGAAMPTGVASGSGGISSGVGGGIVLASGGKKSKKWILAIAGVLVVVAVGVTVVLLVTNRGGNENSTELVSAFNSYANYLLDGKDSSDSVSVYKGLSYSYYFDRENVNLALNESEIESIGGYYDNLSGKLDSFVGIVTSAEIADNKKKIVKDYSEIAKAYFEMRSKYFLNSEDIKEYYSRNGYAATGEFIDNYYATMNGDLVEVKNLKEYLVAAARYYLNEFNAYSTLGCVDGIEINYSCPDDAVVFDYEVTIIELEYAIETVVENARTDVLNGYQEIYNEIIK